MPGSGNATPTSARLPQHKKRRPSATIIAVLSEPNSPARLLAGNHSPRSSSLGLHPCEATPLHEMSRPSVPQLSRQASNASSTAEEGFGEGTPLLSAGASDKRWYHGPLFMTGVKLGILFAVFSIVVFGTFWFGMPKVDPEDRPTLKLPRNFEELKALNTLFQKYKALYPWRMCMCIIAAYLYVQAFTLPGSMYLSILFGAAYGVVPGIILSCLCDSTGSILCYTLSAILGPPLLELPYYRKMLETWRVKIMGDAAKGEAVGNDSVFAILLVLRILPFPPHWVANFVTPHLGISMPLFWLTCFIGIAPVSVIHVMIGTSLDQMTSADDFKILSPRNVFALAAIIVAVLIPVGLKRVFRKDFSDLGEAANPSLAIDGLDAVDDIPAPRTIEFDAHGLPKRYQAVDAGICLGGPSDGDPSLDFDLPRRGAELDLVPRKKDRKPIRRDSARASQILADLDDDADDAGTSAYELGLAEPSTQPKRSKFAALRGYGAIEPVAAQPGAQRSTPWWKLGSK